MSANSEDWAPDGTERIRANFPEFIVLHLEDGDALISCPRIEKRCGNGFVVHYSTWVNMDVQSKTRPCPYCFKVSRVPKEEMHRIPDDEV